MARGRPPKRKSDVKKGVHEKTFALLYAAAAARCHAEGEGGAELALNPPLRRVNPESPSSSSVSRLPLCPLLRLRSVPLFFFGSEYFCFVMGTRLTASHPLRRFHPPIPHSATLSVTARTPPPHCTTHTPSYHAAARSLFVSLSLCRGLQLHPRVVLRVLLLLLAARPPPEAATVVCSSPPSLSAPGRPSYARATTNALSRAVAAAAHVCPAIVWWALLTARNAFL